MVSASKRHDSGSSHLPMALSTVEQRTRYPLMAYNFRVDVAGTSMSFSEVTGLSVEFESVTYQHGLSFLEGEAIASWRYEKYAPMTLRRGVVPGISILSDWLESGETRPLDIHLCDEQGLPRVSWHVGRAVAVKLEASTLTASGNEVAVESLELKVARITVEHL